MLHDAVIVCIGSIDWEFNWQVQQEVAAAFAAAGHRVLFVENTGVRHPKLKDLPRLRARLRNQLRPPRQTHGVDIYSPLLLPLPYSRVACRLNSAAMLRRIRRWVGADRRGPLIIITFLPTPLARTVIKALDAALVVFYAADFLSESSPAARRLRPFEEAMFRDADLVFTTSDALRSFARTLGATPEMLAHGVRFQDFQHARENGQSPALLDGLTKPVVGFVGTIRREIDLALVTKVAERASDFEFVFVGPIASDVSALRALPNVRFIAPVPHAGVMRYMARFDIGILPYVLNAYTRHIMPAKLKEYLAAGLPIVATRLPEICRFAEEHEGMVAFADEPEAFVAALRNVLAERESAHVERRAEVAQRYDWSTQIESMRNSMEAALRKRSGWR